MEKGFSRFIWVALGALILCFWGLYNGYPFVYPDTGAYIFSGFEGRVPPDRPLIYGLFLRHASLMESAVWVMFAQGLLTSIFVSWFLRAFWPRVSPALFIGGVLFLTVASDASVYVSYLTPDLFTPLSYGALALLLFARMPRRRTVFVAVLAWLSLMMHNSNLLGATVLVALVLLGGLLPKFRAALPWRRSLATLGLVAGAWLGLSTLHYVYGGGFSVAQGRHMFTMARLNELGILKNYLDRACAEGKDYRLCAYKDELPEDFLWSGMADNPTMKLGGWAACRDEYNRITGDIFSKPEYLKRYAIASVNTTFSQIFRFESERIGPMGQNSPPYEAIREKFPFELYTYKVAHQNHRPEYLDFSKNAARQQIFFFASLLIGVLLATSGPWRSRAPEPIRQAYGFVAAALLVNAFVCSTFSTLLSRYQGRLVWLFLLISFLVVLYRFEGTKFWPNRSSEHAPD